ncbi:MAG: hypothetical protein QM820_63095 [Minicystis sp.]
MRSGFVQAVLLGLGVCVAVSGACGGKVVVDVPGAAGGAGQGGAPGIVSSSSFIDVGTVGPTTTTGPGLCGCDQVCNAFSACGFSPSNCQGLCDALSTDQRACVCQNNSCDFTACFGTTSSSTGSGGMVSQACGNCANDTTSNNGPCLDALDNCEQTPECLQIVDCHQGCGWSPACRQACDFQSAKGQAAWEGLIGCAICKSCSGPCSSDEVFTTYCIP